ncbi:MAG: transposase [Bacteroidales bacterium]|nr:transposase [Bacteroidales bacterium]
MSEKYKIIDPDKAYFITSTITGWIDVFAKKEHKLVILNSLKFCQDKKGLIIYGYCLMSNHLHMIAQAKDENLGGIIRDFKKYTTKRIIDNIASEKEGRRKWMLSYFGYTGQYLNRIKNYKMWQDGNHPELIYSNDFLWQKLNYIHNNPVKEMIVEKPEHYLFSSARNYAGLDSLLDVELVTPELRSF